MTPRFGAHLLPTGGARFRLWAPGHAHLRLKWSGMGEPSPMNVLPGGWHELDVPGARAGDGYAYLLDDGRQVPDPASRFQPEDVHGPSELVDLDAHRWQVTWSGRAWHEVVLYELHVGTFTPEGTFAAAIEKLDHLAGLGVTAIELMPVAEFPGRRNWGYDGVLLFAPDATYGRPEDLQRLVDAAHARGIAVLLDVVYNHFGPDGNYLPTLAPPFFTERHQTPWGAAVNYDAPGCAEVRGFVIENALHWLRDYRMDGLRLDAVHAIVDAGETHILEDLAARIRAEILDRPVHLLLENEHNEAHHLERPHGEPRRYTAQWNDDVHHVLHVAATGEGSGYYAEYLHDAHRLGRALAEGFAWQGEIMRFSGRARGEPSAQLPPTAFVSFIQNHDQVGNRAFGERIDALAPGEAVRAIASVYLLAPQVPMLFMGEEWAARQPFLFFSDFAGELGDAVRAGRRAEFRRFPEFADPQARERIPDPQDEATFLASKLQWADLSLPGHAQRLHWYRRILAVRRTRIVPLLPQLPRGGSSQVIADGAVFVSWRCRDGRKLRLEANLGPRAVEFPYGSARVIWHEGPAPAETTLGPWSVRWT
ncbi:MAG TPA: malto-oligosyltrehalose trehalohydrolase, partial [Steroidobacteraceae bacterium]|nr:malto-oligosyltrehalose trehalohydrolase [Steroidobacteraceae bacterium]